MRWDSGSIRVVTWLAVLGLWCQTRGEGQIITTFAGTDWLFRGDGAPAINAPLGGLEGIATDKNGNVFVSDYFNNMVFKVSRDGILHIVAGNGANAFSGDGGQAVNASLSLPLQVAVDSAGNVYIPDARNGRIRKVTPNGVITTVAGNGKSGYSGDGGPATAASVNQPRCVAVDGAGNLYIADTFNSRIRMVTPAGLISTVAGNGQSGFSGDNGPATSASINEPWRIAVDSSGLLYIADTANGRVRKLSPDGTISTIAGGGTGGDGGLATSASLSDPQGIAFDPAGNILIADGGNIRRISVQGIISTVAKTSISSLGVAVDPSGTIYMLPFSQYQVINTVPFGTNSVFAGNGLYRSSGNGGPAIQASLYEPWGIAFDRAGNAYFAEFGLNRVRKVSIDGTISIVAGTGSSGRASDGQLATSAPLNNPTGVAADSAGNLYIADSVNSRIAIVAPNGLITNFAGGGQMLGDGGPAKAALLGQPHGLAVDAAGNVYIADGLDNRIRKVTADGVINTIAGNGQQGFSGDGGPATSASMSDPQGVAVDSTGNIYIADSGNNRIRKVSGGTITTVAGNGIRGFSGDGGPATVSSLNQPFGVAVDSTGNIYIADWGNNRIRKASGGTITTIAGNGNFGFAGDGGLATKALLDDPTGLALDPSGNIYVADDGNNRIREVLSDGGSYQVTPPTLSFSASAGGSAPGSQTINLSSVIAGLVFAATSSEPWLSVSPSTGSIPSVLQVSVDPSSLTAGSLSGTITITAPNAIPATSVVAVTVAVSAGTPAALEISTQNVSFTATQGSGALTQQLQVTNTGGGALSFTAATSGGSWLSISAASGTATPSSPGPLTITATPGSLAPGTYSGNVAITGAGTTKNVAVTLSVSAPTAVILISQVGLSFTAVAQGGVPLPQTFGILNTGQGAMSWSATAATLSGGNWVQISPASGTVQTPYLDVSLVTVSIDPAGLGAGTYYARIQVSAAAANTPQMVTVILTVLPAGLSLGPQLYPTGLVFTGVAGVTPGSQDVQVANPAGQVNSFQSGQIGTGFSFLPTNASIQPNQPTTVRVYPDFSSLTPGSISRGTITLQFSDGSPSQTISILFVVAPAGATANRVGRKDARFYHIDLTSAASGCASQNLQVQYRSPALNFAAVTGQATLLEVQVTDGCGNLVGPGGGQSASVTANFSDGDPQEAMTHIGNGIWQVGWKPVKTGPVVVTVLAILPSGNPAATVGGTAAMSGIVSAPSTSATPLVTAQGVVHAASDVGGAPIAPGGLITVYGNNLADGVAQDNGLPLPQTLSGTQVLLGNQPLPILYTNTGQLNVQVPYGVPVNTQYQLTVQHGNSLSVPQSLVVAQAEPGIFTVNQQGTGQGSIVKSDGVTLVQPGTPATAGDTIVIYCTGLGAVSPAVKEGSPAPTTPPLSMTVDPVTVTIGGQAAAVAFSGLTPGFAGLYQINVVVPSGITPGNAVPVVLSIAGQTSPPVTIAVQ
jgi:trimeric autotransporter adhesin